MRAAKGLPTIIQDLHKAFVINPLRLYSIKQIVRSVIASRVPYRDSIQDCREVGKFPWQLLRSHAANQYSTPASSSALLISYYFPSISFPQFLSMTSLSSSISHITLILLLCVFRRHYSFHYFPQFQVLHFPTRCSTVLQHCVTVSATRHSSG